MSVLKLSNSNCLYDTSSNNSISLEEESPESNSMKQSLCLSSPKDDFIKNLLSIFKKEESLTLKDKLEYSYNLSIAIVNLNEEILKELNEEECHLSMLNWVWRYRKKIKEFRFENEIKNNINLFQNFDYFFPNKFNKLLIEINFIIQLLINILNIFKFLPITSNEILTLKLFDKLSKIKGYIKSFASEEVLNLTDFVLSKWKNQIDFESEQKIISSFKLNKLGIKRRREEKIEEKATEADSADSDTNNDSIINMNNISNNKNININKKQKNKNIKVSFDLSKNSVIYFKKDDAPCQITLVKE